MSTIFIVKTFFEIAAALLVIWGVYNEDKLIRFEERVKIILVVNYRRHKRKKALLKQQEAMRNISLGEIQKGNIVFNPNKAA